MRINADGTVSLNAADIAGFDRLKAHEEDVVADLKRVNRNRKQAAKARKERRVAREEREYLRLQSEVTPSLFKQIVGA